MQIQLVDCDCHSLIHRINTISDKLHRRFMVWFEFIVDLLFLMGSVHFLTTDFHMHTGPIVSPFLTQCVARVPGGTRFM